MSSACVAQDLTATPRISVRGDNAETAGYSFVVLKESDRWYFWYGRSRPAVSRVVVLRERQ